MGLEGPQRTIVMCSPRYGVTFVLLTNKKRRALHDFMAGTVVIRA
jgi:uncharacterized RDD family membrane protein YckC